MSKNLKVIIYFIMIFALFSACQQEQVRHKKGALKKIAFYSTGCFGACPSMSFEIDSSGFMLFEGKGYTDQLGYYKGQISEEDFDLIQQKVNAVKWDSLEMQYIANHTDGQTRGLEITFQSHQQKCSVYGHSDEPKALRFLFQQLMGVYKNVNLEKDTVADWRYNNSALMNFVSPPPPIK